MEINLRYHELSRLINWHEMLFGHDRPKRVFEENEVEKRLTCKIHYMISELIDEELERRRNDPRYDYSGDNDDFEEK